jgi:hypothetical protein
MVEEKSLVMEFPTQTPLFYAANRARYERQNFIKQIEEYTKRKLIVYIANLNHPQSVISRNDIPPFADIYADITTGSSIDFLLHSPGGDPNAAEQIVNILLSKSNDIRVIIPLSAKSAATMISLVANEIIMSDSSELGPIDPQIPIQSIQGVQYRPAKALLNGIDKIQEDVMKNGGVLNAAYYPILQGIDPALIDFCVKTIDHSKRLAQKWVQRSMCPDQQKAKEIAEQLVDTEKYPSHGMVINWQEAQTLGLNVRYLQHDDELWQAIWRLFCMYDNDVKTNKLIKIIEGARASVAI